MNPTRRESTRAGSLGAWHPGVSGGRAGAPLGLERARAVGPRAASRSMHGPDEAGPGVRVLSGLSAGAGQLSEAGPVRVVKVEQPGGPEHRRRKPCKE